MDIRREERPELVADIAARVIAVCELHAGEDGGEVAAVGMEASENLAVLGCDADMRSAALLRETVERGWLNLDELGLTGGRVARILAQVRVILDMACRQRSHRFMFGAADAGAFDGEAGTLLLSEMAAVLRRADGDHLGPQAIGHLINRQRRLLPLLRDGDPVLLERVDALIGRLKLSAGEVG